MLQGDDLALQLFIGATALWAAGVAVTQGGYTHKLLVRSMFGLSALLFVIAIFWGKLKEISPGISSEVASFIGPVAWFTLITFALGTVMVLDYRARMNTSIQRSRLPSRPKETVAEPILFGIIKSFIETTDRSLIGISIVRCDASAKNNTGQYLDSCKFVARVSAGIGENESSISGNLPQEAIHRIHLIDIMLKNLSGEYLGYQFDEISEFYKSNPDIVVIRLGLSGVGVGLIEKTFFIRNIWSAGEYLVVSYQVQS